jgi:membrane protease subunit HflK
VPAAQGQAQRQRLDAEAYKLQVIGTAEGDAARFDPLVAAYARSPQVMRDRLYIETIETILARSRKLIIDGKGGGNTLVLPLDKLSEAGALRAAGVTGVITGAGTGTAAAAGTGTGAGASAAAAAPGTTPASGASPARDDRSRDRGQRP